MFKKKVFATFCALFLNPLLFSSPVFSQEQVILTQSSCKLSQIAEPFGLTKWVIVSQSERISEEDAKAIPNLFFHRFMKAVDEERHEFRAFPSTDFYRYTLTMVNGSWFDVSMRFLQGSMVQSPFIWIARDFAPLIPGFSYVKIQLISPLSPLSHDFSIEIHVEDLSGWDVLKNQRATIITPVLKRHYLERFEYTEGLAYFLEEIAIRPLSDDVVENLTCSSLK